MKEKVMVMRCGGGLYLNFEDRELMQEAAHVLERVCFQETKDKIFNVKPSGKVLVLTKPTWKIDLEIIRDDSLVEFADRGVYKLQELVSEAKMSGWHNKEGVVILSGANIKPGVKVEESSIYDLTPTILYLMGFPVARDMDGRLMTEALKDDVLDEKPIRYIDTYEDASAERKPSEETDRKKIEERLKALGYL
jgi:predicted AlkP superfamily phosphohydrolase/phosphomutase